MQKFSKKEALQFGWNTLKNNFFLFFIILTGVGVFNLIIYFIKLPLAQLISYVVGIIMNMGLIKIALKLYDNEEAKFSDFWKPLPLFFKYIVSNILLNLIIFALLLGLVVVGLIIGSVLGITKGLASSIFFGTAPKITTVIFLFVMLVIAFFLAANLFVRYSFFGYFIIDKNYGPIRALVESYRITKGSVWNLFILYLLFTLIYLGGVLLFLIGLYVSIPIIVLSQTFVYRRLSVQVETKQE
jgi:hypothetical protein